MKRLQRHGGSGNSNGNRAGTTAAGTPKTALGIGADGIAFVTAMGAESTAMGTATSAANTIRTDWHFWRGVTHIVQ